MKKQRLDTLLIDRGLVASRERARALIMAGVVKVAGQVVSKAGTMVKADAEVELREADHPWVSRGGLKLVRALDAFGIDPTGRVALDVGASTGGFTDVLLDRGARRVYAIDVGYGQLHWKLRNDDRVVVIERQNIRHLDPTAIDEPADLAVIDVSFISLAKVLPKVVELLEPGATIAALIKPQFEVGRDRVGKGGVVRDAAARADAVAAVCRFAEGIGLQILGEPVESPITGPAGNVEYLVALRCPKRP
jgi:23S rRNA (cytidine1920-2'-O)/16S rRNA (cytidine1409-2'-O)-methyltransferase